MTLAAATGLLACPVCGDQLAVEARPVACPRGHHFDVARQGYLNLLRGAQPRNADTADMIAARARVHGSGFFDPLAQGVAAALTGAAILLDAGCGTGAYAARYLESATGSRAVGIDVSVPAVRVAARAHPRLAVVADTWAAIPVATAAVDAVLCAFAPRNGAEFARVLTPGGRLVVVTPGPGHLATLRERYGLLGIAADKDERLLGSLDGFVARETTIVRATSEAPARLLHDVVAMGPNAFHAVPDVAAGPLEIDVTIRTFLPRDHA